ncbi:unnamed protein product [Parnassius apollo]|uniref:(apollo) hypothetical protein n=1 Tax=Parnassius apollo TaxID=110799 RepID=A0A8S3XM10_PARAO|nr:unnamed protein product [Parnassius apollo]
MEVAQAPLQLTQEHQDGRMTEGNTAFNTGESATLRIEGESDRSLVTESDAAGVAEEGSSSSLSSIFIRSSDESMEGGEELNQSSSGGWKNSSSSSSDSSLPSDCAFLSAEESTSPLRWSPPTSAALVAAALAPPALRPWLPEPPTKKANHLGKTGWHHH